MQMVSTNNSNERTGITDKYLWEFAMVKQNALTEFMVPCKTNCDSAIKSCCCGYATFYEVNLLRESFWGIDSKMLQLQNRERNESWILSRMLITEQLFSIFYF